MREEHEQVNIEERMVEFLERAQSLDHNNDKNAVRAYRDDWYKFMGLLDDHERIALRNDLLVLTINGSIPVDSFGLMSRWQERRLAETFRILNPLSGIDGKRYSPKDSGRIVTAVRARSNFGEFPSEVKEAVKFAEQFANLSGPFSADYGDRKRAQKSVHSALDAVMARLGKAPTTASKTDGDTLEGQLTALEVKITKARAEGVKAKEIVPMEDELDELRKQLKTQKAATAKARPQGKASKGDGATHGSWLTKIQGLGENDEIYLQIAGIADTGSGDAKERAVNAVRNRINTLLGLSGD